MHGVFHAADDKNNIMSVLMTVGARISVAFWRALETIGRVFKVAGALALLGSFVVLFNQTLTFMRDDYWPSKSLLLALPDTVVGWLISVGDLAGFSVPLVDFLSWMPLWVVGLVGSILAFALGKLLAYKGDLTER